MPSESVHPDPSTLEAFALGQIEISAMRRVEDHLARCPSCARVVQSVPDDRLVALLRRPALVPSGP